MRRQEVKKMNRLMRGLHVVGVATVLALPVGQASAALITTQVGAGAFIRAGAVADNNYSTLQYLNVKHTPAPDDQALFKFTSLPALPAGEVVGSARIGLNMRGANSLSVVGAGLMRPVLRELDTAWNAATLTWNNAPGSSSLLSEAGDMGSTPQDIGLAQVNNWTWFDVPAALVQGWYDDPTSNHGVRLVPLDVPELGSIEVWFHNFNNASPYDPLHRPMLEITTVIPEPTTGLLLVLGSLAVCFVRRRMA